MCLVTDPRLITGGLKEPWTADPRLTPDRLTNLRNRVLRLLLLESFTSAIADEQGETIIALLDEHDRVGLRLSENETRMDDHEARIIRAEKREKTIDRLTAENIQLAIIQQRDAEEIRKLTAEVGQADDDRSRLTAENENLRSAVEERHVHGKEPSTTDTRMTSEAEVRIRDLLAEFHDARGIMFSREDILALIEDREALRVSRDAGWAIAKARGEEINKLAIIQQLDADEVRELAVEMVEAKAECWDSMESAGFCGTPQMQALERLADVKRRIAEAVKGGGG
jgi:hypothetical protein